ncbi:MAG TPA: hypothetical protein VNM24_14820 [Burkholderiales bacterium]|jgi:hypothetical protein|nr:hypothetical protein [Burkholderiales bacterium]
MKSALAIIVALALCACGVSETASTAATGASIKAQEAKQAEQTKQQFEKKLEDANRQLQNRADASDQ